MTVLVLCNVGARDVMDKGQELRPARAQGQRLLDLYPAGAEDLSFPIIEPCLRYIAAMHPANREQPAGIDRLVLFGTDQPDPAYRPSDTLYFARLAAQCLPQRPGSAVRQADACLVQGINPALYDEAFEQFDRLLAPLPNDGIEACYVILCGGIPACNTALLLQGVRHYGERLRVVYAPQGGEPQELRAGLQVTNAFREAAAIEHLERLDFANALPRLRRLEADPGLLDLVTYAAQRLAFDFPSAQASMLHALRDGNRAVREYIEFGPRHELRLLLTDSKGPVRLGALLQELYWNAAITFDHCRYADFLGRVYRFQEAVLRWLVERVFGLRTDLQPALRKANQLRWNEAIQANPRLLDFLRAQTVDGRPLDWQNINRPTYKAMLRYATSAKTGLDANDRPLLAEGERARYQALLERVNALDRLVDLRHRTIIGHDFQGVSEGLLLEHYKGAPWPDGGRRTPVEGLEEILRIMELAPRSNPYRSMADFVIRTLRRQ